MSDEDHFIADDDTMEVRETLAEDALSNPDWEGYERETAIRFSADSDRRYVIQSFQRAVVSNILQHSMAKIQNATLLVDGKTVRESDPEEALDCDYDRVVGVEATLPLGTLTIKGSKRSSDTPGSIVSTPKQAQQARDAFSGDDDDG